ncbi:MAG: DUF3299 domain-containing protein [Candidatus Hydrogenedentes bacterium]|nr:DUF3299 domain-containing protein [Candidatus Hydrogenedentota bacterium]
MKNLLYAVSVFAVAIALGALVSYMIPGTFGGQKKNVDLNQVMDLADKAAPQAKPAADAVRGAPLTAPAEPAATPDPGDNGNVPMGNPLGDNYDTSGMQPTRVISQEAMNLLQQVEGPLSDDPEKLLQFEKTKDGNFTKISFAALGSFEYEVPDPEVVRNAPDPAAAVGKQVPEPIVKLNESPVVIVGFMVPIDVDKEGRVKSFALTQNQMFCCYGIPPAMNQWLMVEMAEGTYADFTMDLPVAAYGNFDVGEEIEDGYILSLYRMTASEVIDVQELLRRTEEAKG